MKFDHKKKYFGSSEIRARLSFDEGFRERPLYAIKAKVTEKDKGIDMIELIKQHFNISQKDEKEAFEKKMEFFRADFPRPTKIPKEIKQQRIKWTRDNKGRVVSPFRAKRE